MAYLRSKTWKESNDPDRDAKRDRIEEVLHQHPNRCFTFDEFGPLAIHPTGGDGRAARRRSGSRRIATRSGPGQRGIGSSGVHSARQLMGEPDRGPLREFVLNNTSHPNHMVLTRRLHAHLHWRNANARSPELLAAQRRERARSQPEGATAADDPLPAPGEHPREGSWTRH